MAASDNRGALLAQILSFLGKGEPSALAGRESEMWYPIDGTGCYFVAENPPSSESCPLSLGAMYAYPQPPATDGFSATLRLQLPLVDLDDGSLLLESEPVLLALQLTGGFSSATALPGGVSLAGIELTATLAVDGSPPTLDLVLQQLAIGSATPQDISLAELAKDPSQLLGKFLETAVEAAIARATSKPALQNDLLWLLGLTGSQVSAGPFAQLDSGFAAAWCGWFQGILKDSRQLPAWLDGIFCLTQGLDVTTRDDAQRATDLIGSGTEAEPFAITLIGGGSGQAALEATLFTTPAAPGSTTPGTFTPGLRLVSPPAQASLGPPVTMQATLQLGSFSRGRSRPRSSWRSRRSRAARFSSIRIPPRGPIRQRLSARRIFAPASVSRRREGSSWSRLPISRMGRLRNRW